MPVRRLLILAALLVPQLAHAQASGVRGRFLDATTRAPVASVQVRLTSLADTTVVHQATARDSGTFAVIGIALGAYRLDASRIGYAPLTQTLQVTQPRQDLGVFALTPVSVPVSGLTVTESPAPAIQKGDTTEYRASAVKTHKDATAEDLVQKLPGVTIEDGQVKAQGENVQQVLVNGRPFFGSDPAAAMRNLPAEVVDRIQVYDRGSDQSEFSGFDDGQQQRTLNFILRDQKARFGKVYGGYGDQDLYQAGGNITTLRGSTRLTLIGMSNNINQRNFSQQDLVGATSGSGGSGGGGQRMMRGGGGPRGGGRGFGGGQFDPSSFLVNPQSGLTTTHSGGVNYVGQWGKEWSASSSVFISQTDTDNLQSLARQYLPPQDSLAFYEQRATTDSRNGNQRFDARVEWTPDSANSVIFQPRLYFQNTKSSTGGVAANTTDERSTLSASDSRSNDDIDGNNLSGRMTLRHRFAKRGRNISAELNSGSNLRDGQGAQYSLTESFEGTTTTSDTLDQETDSRTVTRSLSTRIAYTEPLSSRLQAQLIYHPSRTRSESDALGYRFDAATGGYTQLDPATSNSYENRNTIHNGGVALLHTRGRNRLLANLSYQNQRLESDQTFPVTSALDHSFQSLLPSVTFTGTFANRRNVRVAWTTSTTAPTIGQLQNVVNNSNPLSLTTGNPDLRPTYNHSLSVRLSDAEPAKSRSKFLFMNLTRTAHPIVNSTFTSPVDSTVGGVFLARGTQLTRPLNLDESWNGNLFAVYSRPIQQWKSVLSLNGGGSFSRTPTRVNSLDGRNTTSSIRTGIVVSSNISANLDFQVSYWSTFNYSRNPLVPSNDGDYFTHNAGLRLNAVVAHGFVLRQELNHNLQTGASAGYGQDIVLWNTSVGKKFLADQKGEVRLTVTDALQQNQSLSRSITETYVQDSRDLTLSRYVQAVFTYTFR